VGDERYKRLKSNLSKDFQQKAVTAESSIPVSIKGIVVDGDTTLLSFFTAAGTKLAQDLKQHILAFLQDFPSSLKDWNSIHPMISQVVQDLDRFEMEISDSSFQRQYEKVRIKNNNTFFLGSSYGYVSYCTYRWSSTPTSIPFRISSNVLADGNDLEELWSGLFSNISLLGSW
jgi:hypothetical protein